VPKKKAQRLKTPMVSKAAGDTMLFLLFTKWNKKRGEIFHERILESGFPNKQAV
jgi:hypothetical protein